MTEVLTEPTVANLRKASTAIYLATEKCVADDVSNLLKWSANEIERLSASSARVEVLEAALEPFAKVAQHISPQCPADYSLMQIHDLTAKHFRNASAALPSPSTEGKV